MTLEEVIDVMKDADAKGLDVARVHTGDPAVFGAHREQMDALDRLGIAHEVIPGVSSFPRHGGGAAEGVYASGRISDGHPHEDGGQDADAAEGEASRFGET